MSLRDIILWFMPAPMQADAETESRKWVATCPRCQAESSVWDMGGLRYKAVGQPIRLMRCPKCGKASPMRIHRKQG